MTPMMKILAMAAVAVPIAGAGVLMELHDRRQIVEGRGQAEACPSDAVTVLQVKPGDKVVAGVDYAYFVVPQSVTQVTVRVTPSCGGGNP